MKQNDIEDILEQYGNDKRQQQQLSAHLRHLARRQRHVRVGIVSAIAIIAGVLAALKLVSPTQQTTPILASSSTIPTAIADTTSYPTADTISHPQTKRNSHPTQLSIPPTGTILQETISNTLADDEQKATFEADTDISPATEPVIQTTSPLLPTKELIAEQTIPTQPIEISASNHLVPPHQESRLNLITSINASAMSNGNIAYAAETDGFTYANGESFTTIDPALSLSANIGAAYTVAANQTCKLDIGLSLSGHTEQGIANKYIAISNANNSSIDGSTTTVHSVDEYTYNAFSLYANMPVKLNFYPSGQNKTGWSLSITPAHSIARTRQLGTDNHSPYEINPWKLTVGIGIVIPRRFIRHIGLAANLLPTYTSKSVHEIGIEIGF